jgi:hypothetical protein
MSRYRTDQLEAVRVRTAEIITTAASTRVVLHHATVTSAVFYKTSTATKHCVAQTDYAGQEYLGDPTSSGTVPRG